MKFIERLLESDKTKNSEGLRNAKFRTEIILGIFFLLVNIIFIVYLCAGQKLYDKSEMAVSLVGDGKSTFHSSEDGTVQASNLSKKQLETQVDSNYNNTAKENTQSQKGQTAKETAINNSQTDKKKVYLTFDDGPSKNTEKILDILAQNDVKATFFVIGKEDSYSKEIYKRIVSEGHTLGMHSYSHNYSTLYQSKKAFIKDLTKIQNLMEETTGEKPCFYRFPGGTSNTVSKISMKNFIKILNKKKIVYFDWNAMTGDASGKNLTKSQMIRNVIKDVEIHNTSVVLLHDAADKDKTVETLPALIKKLKKMDVALLPLDENATLVQHVKAESVK